MDNGDVAVERISARLMEVRLQFKGKSNDVYFAVGYAPILDETSVKHIHFGVYLRWSRGYPVGTTSTEVWVWPSSS